MKAPKKKVEKRGRKKGTTTGYTQQGLSLRENEQRAILGKHHLAGLGAGLTHQLWTRRNKLYPPQDGTPFNAAAAAFNARDAKAPDWYINPLLAAIDKRDSKFFRDAADMLDLIVDGSGKLRIADPREAALSDHARRTLTNNPQHRFGNTELLDAVDWRTFGASCPSAKNLGDLCRKLGIPMAVGRPRMQGKK